MVQLPATAAIEYVAACWMSRAGGIYFLSGGAFVWGGILPGGTFSPEVFCPGALLAGGEFWPGGFLSGGDAFVFCPGDLLPGGFLSGGAFVWGVFCPGDFCPGAYARSPKFNAYTHRVGFLCLAS